MGKIGAGLALEQKICFECGGQGAKMIFLKVILFYFPLVEDALLALLRINYWHNLRCGWFLLGNLPRFFSL